MGERKKNVRPTLAMMSEMEDTVHNQCVEGEVRCVVQGEQASYVSRSLGQDFQQVMRHENRGAYLRCLGAAERRGRR